MKKILLSMMTVVILSVGASANSDEITFKEMGVAIDKLIDNQVLLEKRYSSLIKSDDSSNNQRIDELERNMNKLYTEIQKFNATLSDLQESYSNQSKHPIKVIVEDNIQKDNIVQIKKVVVVTKKANLRSQPKFDCSNVTRKVKYLDELNVEKSNHKDYYKVVGEKKEYINKIVVADYKEGKKYELKNVGSKKSCGQL